MVQTLRALAEPNRLRIVELLREKPRSVNDIVTRLRLKQPLVSKHLRTLSETGLVLARPVAHQRFYALRAEPFAELEAWLDTFTTAWASQLDQFDDYLQVMKAEKRKRSGGSD